MDRRRGLRARVERRAHRPLCGGDDAIALRRNIDEIDRHVGTRLRLRRLAIGMSQEALAEAMGMTFQQIQKYESGANRIGASRLYSLTRILGVEVGYFFADAPAAAAGQAAEAAPAAGGAPDEAGLIEFLATAEGLELNRCFRRIEDPAVRRSIVEMVRSLAGPGPRD